MYRSLKTGKFVPHEKISSDLNQEHIRKLVMKMAVTLANQVYETGTVSINQQQLTEEEMVAFVEIVIHELIYYHQIGEIGCFLATAFADDESDAIDPDTPQSSSSQEEAETADCGGFLCRSASAAAPAIGQIATNLLVASGDIRKKITHLFMEMAMPNELFMLGPAGYSNSKDPVQQQYYHGRLVQTMMIRLGGKVEIKCGLTLDQVLEHIVGIAKSSWALMDLCANSNAFRFTQSSSPLFNTIQIDPMESVFGNWKQTSTPPSQQLECDDDVPSSIPNTYVLDYDSSGWDEFDEDQRRGGGYDHAEEAS